MMIKTAPAWYTGTSTAQIDPNTVSFSGGFWDSTVPPGNDWILIDAPSNVQIPQRGTTS